MSSTVLYTVPSDSNPNKSYEICRDDSNGGRLWCRVAGTTTGCTSWTVGWKRAREDHHTCKHQRAAIAALGMRTVVRDDFEYVTSLGLADARGRDAVATFTNAVNSARAGGTPAPAYRTYEPPRRQGTPSAAVTRAARPAGPPPSRTMPAVPPPTFVRPTPVALQRAARPSGPPPSLEQVRKAIPRATEGDLIRRGPRRRPDDD